ncbi:unnamed protein product [Adineta ricciae]|uniref:CUB domain-containing protein n=1 Tax=Adineta ricciae TaxID=249248 RepID=A0A814QVC0_ADIRI|nr:unnamed protein product [Adineta ricciae]
MAPYLFFILSIALCNVINAKYFEYELPNRTVTICPTSSLISIECPQASEYQTWQSNLPPFLISIDYIRSFPSRLGLDASSCQADPSNACHNYDLRYINTLCNGKSYCPDIPAYQIRDRSSCAFKAVTEIGYHCVPTWNLRDIQTKCDICKNGSLTNDYGFIYSRNYPLQTLRIPCFTTIYARPYHKTVLYFVTGQLNFDEIRIESVSSEGITILNITLNGNQTAHRVAESTYELKITFLPGQIYSPHLTNYLLYFYTIPYCSYVVPCPPIPSIPTTASIPPMTAATNRTRIQSVGWTRITNMWIVIPIILAYVLLLLLVIVLALLFQRRRKQRKALDSLNSKTTTSRYLDTSGTSSRAQLVTPLPPPSGTGMSTYRRSTLTRSTNHPIYNSSFAQNMERYHRESRSDFDLHHNSIYGTDYSHHSSMPYRSRTPLANQSYRPYGTIDYSGRNYNANQHRRRSLPKSFSDCDLCKRHVFTQEYQHYYDEDDNWRLENSVERRAEPRPYREKLKERFRERLTVRHVPDSDALPSSSVEYSTILPRHQRISSESARGVQHLPFEYIPNDNSKNVRTVEYKRNSNQEHVAIGNNQHRGLNDESGTSNFTVKFYERDDDDDELNTRLDRCLHETREVQEMSMRMSEQQSFNRHQQKRFYGNAEI